MDWPVLPRRIHCALAGLCCLARSQGPVTAREVAACGGVPPAEAAKVLQHLVWAGLVESRRGKKGGFWLRKPPQEIQVAQVIQFFSRPESRDAPTPILNTLRELSEACTAAFSQLTIAELSQLENKECGGLVSVADSLPSRTRGDP